VAVTGAAPLGDLKSVLLSRRGKGGLALSITSKIKAIQGGKPRNRTGFRLEEGGEWTQGGKRGDQKEKRKKTQPWMAERGKNEPKRGNAREIKKRFK